MAPGSGAPLGHKLEGELWEPLQRLVFGFSTYPAREQATGRGVVEALPMGPPASWQPHCRGSRRQTPPPPSSCKQRAEEGRVRQPHPLMAHTGLGQVRSHPRPLPALGAPSCPRGSLGSCC